MKTKALYILFLSLLPFIVLSQKHNKAEEYLQKMYQGFPLGKERAVIQEYLAHNNFVVSPSIYDSTRIDYRKIINSESINLYQPRSSTIEHFYAYDWGFGQKEIEHARISALTLNYGESDPESCHNQFKELVKDLKGMSAKSENYQSYADAGKIGEGFKFYRSKKDKIPFLTIDLTDKSCTGTSCYIFIAYLEQLDE